MGSRAAPPVLAGVDADRTSGATGGWTGNSLGIAAPGRSPASGDTSLTSIRTTGRWATTAPRTSPTTAPAVVTGGLVSRTTLASLAIGRMALRFTTGETLATDSDVDA
jgi:hypothetical protein